jgi:hypothetical protein
MTKLLHINIRVKKTKIDSLLHFGSQDNLISMDMVKNIGLEVHDHPRSYPLGWVNKDAYIKVTNKCNNKFVVSVDFIDEVELDVVPLDVSKVVFGSPYMYIGDSIFM